MCSVDFSCGISRVGDFFKARVTFLLSELDMESFFLLEAIEFIVPRLLISVVRYLPKMFRPSDLRCSDITSFLPLDCSIDFLVSVKAPGFYIFKPEPSADSSLTTNSTYFLSGDFIIVFGFRTTSSLSSSV